MKILLRSAWLVALAALLPSHDAAAQSRAQYESLVAKHAKANHLPEALVHRVIVRESKYHPELVGRGGTIGLMQLKLATARGVGYTGDAAGLHDPDTNLAYGVKYLAGAYRAAERDHDLAVRYFASGYYYVAKRQRLERQQQAAPVLASVSPKADEPAKEPIKEPIRETAKEAVKEDSKPAAAAPPETRTAPPRSESKTAKRPAKPLDITPKAVAEKPAAKPKAGKKLAEANPPVPRPPASVPAGAKGAKPR